MTKSTYQTPAVPRFYIDDFNWLLSLGWSAHHPDWIPYQEPESGSWFWTATYARRAMALQAHITKLVVMEHEPGTFYHNKMLIDNAAFADQLQNYMSPPIPRFWEFFGNKFFCAILNHDWKGLQVGINAWEASAFGEPVQEEGVQIEADDVNPLNINLDLIAGGNGETYADIGANGWSLAHLKSAGMYEYICGVYPSHRLDGINQTTELNHKLGSWVVGHYFDMDHAMNLEVEMGWEYDGYKIDTTLGGSHTTNINYHQVPHWGGYPAFELDSFVTGGEYDPVLYQAPHSRSGRRFWDMTFSMYDKKKIFPRYSAVDTLYGTDEDGVDFDAADYGFAGEYASFYERVIHRTMGGALPFIFIPDGSNPNPDQFCLCRFDQNSFNFKQTAPDIWEFDLRVIEAW